MNRFWNWKKIKNESEQETPTLILDGEIASESWFGDEITPKLFRDELSKYSGMNIDIWINSGGGDCIAAAQIYNMLIEHKGEVNVYIDGIAASAASVIAMAGTKVIMSPVANMMIHNPSTMAWGDVEDLERAKEMLNEVKESIINAYEIKTNLRRSKISEMMTNETWMNAKKALELGFCDEILKREVEDYSSAHISSNVITEMNLTNKLKEKYLIKKPNDNISILEINDRLEKIKKEF